MPVFPLLLTTIEAVNVKNAKQVRLLEKQEIRDVLITTLFHFAPISAGFQAGREFATALPSMSVSHQSRLVVPRSRPPRGVQRSPVCIWEFTQFNNRKEIAPTFPT